MLLLIPILFLLVVISWQDFQDREVSWILFPLLAIMFYFYSIHSITNYQLWTHFWQTLIFLLAQILLLGLYISIKNRKVMNLFKHYLGLGDVLFMATLTLLLAPLHYYLFYIGSLIAILIKEFVTRFLLKTERNITIPMAGIQAFLLIVVLLISTFCNCFSVCDDHSLSMNLFYV